LIAYILGYLPRDEMMLCLEHPFVEFGFVRIVVIALLASLMDLVSNRELAIVARRIEPHEIIYLPLQNLVLVRILNGLCPIAVTVLSLLELLLEITKGCRVGESQKPLESGLQEQTYFWYGF